MERRSVSTAGGPPLTSVALATGVTLEVELLGPRDAPPVFLLHGFPESYRTWRHQVLALALQNRLIIPNQRGYGNSSRPEAIAEYIPEVLMGDVLALADALGHDRFAVVGHDWGGVLGWGLAMRHPQRIARLAILNAPHPQIFQRQVVENPAQRRAAQFIRIFRELAADGDPTRAELERFFDALFVRHLAAPVSREERARYIDEWVQPGAMRAMTHWYRASDVLVPTPFEAVAVPQWAAGPFSLVSRPTLVLWGMRDPGLLPSLLDGLERLVPDLRLLRIAEAGHFPQWEAPAVVSRALAAFLAQGD